MKIFRNLEEVKNIENTVVALGNFDGIHRGHRELIERTVRTAKNFNMKSAVFTFSNHPKNMGQEELVVKNILYKEEKEQIIEELGVDYLFHIPFDENIKSMKPLDFIDFILIEKFSMKQAYCGFNYRFGYKATGTPETLIKEGIEKGFGIHILEPYTVSEEIVSSSLIRKAIEEGNMELCKEYLGRDYSIGGEVVVGNRIGKTIGFPTSNIVIDENMVTPSNGVYITICSYNGVDYPSVSNVGIKPTISQGKNYKKNIETHIFNFDKELYGKSIKVKFLSKMRDEVQFDSVEELSEQILTDCIKAKAYHRSLF